eukprot:scaffold1434_cov184-Prasinococcus_capsulatus_cf.AAC.1
MRQLELSLLIVRVSARVGSVSRVLGPAAQSCEWRQMGVRHRTCSTVTQWTPAGKWGLRLRSSGQPARTGTPEPRTATAQCPQKGAAGKGRGAAQHHLRLSGRSSSMTNARSRSEGLWQEREMRCGVSSG